MESQPYAEELRAQLQRSRARRSREHDRNVARMLSPWRRRGATPDASEWN